MKCFPLQRENVRVEKMNPSIKEYSLKRGKRRLDWIVTHSLTHSFIRVCGISTISIIYSIVKRMEWNEGYDEGQCHFSIMAILHFAFQQSIHQFIALT